MGPPSVPSAAPSSLGFNDTTLLQLVAAFLMMQPRLGVFDVFMLLLVATLRTMLPRVGFVEQLMPQVVATFLIVYWWGRKENARIKDAW